MIRALTICLASLGLLVAGCGGDDGASQEDYEREVSQVGTTLEETFGQLGESISGSGSAEAAAEQLEQGASSLDEAAADLDDIEPPSDIEDEHNQIVEGLGTLADEFRGAAEAAQEGNLDELLEFAQGLEQSEAVKQITEAGNAIEEQGYEFQSDGQEE